MSLKAEEVIAAFDLEQRCAVCGVRYSEMICAAVYEFRVSPLWTSVVVCGTCDPEAPRNMDGFNATYCSHVQACPPGHKILRSHLEWLYGKHVSHLADDYVPWDQWLAACR